MRKRVLVSAAGTASAFHLVKSIRRRFAESISIIACDTNPRHLVACGTMCEDFFQVPPVTEPQFSDAILSIIKDTGCELYIPLIDRDLDLFAGDSAELALLNCRSTAPPRSLTAKVTDKERCFAWLKSAGLPTPGLIGAATTDVSRLYFVKPRRGFGSRGTRAMTGQEIRQGDLADAIVQEICQPPEITVEIYRRGSTVETLCRERIETKQGVCTKARVFADSEFHRLARRAIEGEQWPVASCIQFMRDGGGNWVIIDVNLRIGAGSALCTAVGWDLASAALATWLELDGAPERFLQFDGRDHHVVRAYTEIVTD